MKCPKCGAEFGTPRIISTDDKVNEFGRREITYSTEAEDYIHYDREKETYSCSKCGHVFSMREAIMQK